MKEMEAPELNMRSASIPVFDHAHGSSNGDDSLSAPQFHGTNNPHVGNGRGPIG